MKVVVIGGSGLIGSGLVARLREAGHEAVAASPSTGVNSVTGDGLGEAMEGADVVVDVANSPSFEDAAVLAFFQSSTRNLLAAEKEQGVGHHVALSIVNCDQIPDSGYMRAKAAQETLIQESGTPYTILRATQFFEFLDAIAASNTADDGVRLPSALFQPVAAEDVIAALAELAVGPPLVGTRDLAGPDRLPFDKMIRRYFAAKGDARPVIRDDSATYFGAQLADGALVPAGDTLVGTLNLEAWLEKSASHLV